MAVTYTTADEVRAQAAPRTLPQDDDELDAVILLAERDVDRRLPDLQPGDGSLKLAEFLTGSADAATVDALSRGTAQQTLYRLHMGYAFFIESHQQVGGKDYSTNGAPPKFSQMATDILRTVGLLQNSGRMWQGRNFGVVSTGQRRWSW